MSKKNTYRLINPYIEGSINRIVHAKNAYSAGKKIYNELSEYFTNHIENFNMTIMNVETKDLTHYNIREQRKGDLNEIEFAVNMLSNNLPKKTESELVENIIKMEKQSGGKKKHYRKDDSSDSSDSSDSDSSFESSYASNYYNVLPITKFVYFHLPYYKLINISPIDYNRLFLPIFTLPLSPSVEVRFDLYKF
jgi:hypothetical protein